MQKLIFNPKGSNSVQDRKVISGDTTNMINLTEVKYKWAQQLYKQMRENFWVPEKIDITQDVLCYNELTEDEQRAFDGILAYLLFLDSVQVSNLPHILKGITAPEISMCLAEQISQEGLHNDSYRYVIETILPKEKWEYINNLWKHDQVLLKRCEFIAQHYQNYVNSPTKSNYIKALIADYVLEGIYFYQGFVFFYSLASRHKMLGSADIFKLINKDELSHVRLYQKIILAVFKEEKELSESLGGWIYEFFRETVASEIDWWNYILGDRILGITTKSIESYTKFLANTRLQAIGLDYLYSSENKNPYKHLEKLADSSKAATTKVNFFDSTPLYVQSSQLNGWDDI